MINWFPFYEYKFEHIFLILSLWLNTHGCGIFVLVSNGLVYKNPNLNRILAFLHTSTYHQYLE